MKGACKKKSYLPGGDSYPIFGVGIDIETADGTHYTARNLNIPGEENANRLQWHDAADTQIYSLGATRNNKALDLSGKAIKHQIDAALDTLRVKQPEVIELVGKFLN